MKRRYIFLAMGALGLGCASPARKIEPVSGFEVDRYLGKWYEVARFPHVFEKGLINVTAQYEKDKRGRISVKNRGQREETGQWTSIEGHAKIAKRSDKADLRVTFFWPFRATYRVVALDKEAYQWALVISSNYNYLWILSRTPTLNQDVLEDLISRAEEMGFDTSRLMYVEQSEP